MRLFRAMAVARIPNAERACALRFLPDKHPESCLDRSSPLNADRNLLFLPDYARTRGISKREYSRLHAASRLFSPMRSAVRRRRRRPASVEAHRHRDHYMFV